jgi:hypothetical protein
MTAELHVQLTKRTDGSVVLRCTRRDGSVTWQRYDKHSDFYPFHDLRHFAVESVLGCRSGFYGLLADGWDIADTGGKGPRGKLSPASIFVEHIVGLLDRESVCGASPLSAVEFNAQLEQMVGVDPTRTPITETQLIRVRSRSDELHRQWVGMPRGSALDLNFTREPNKEMNR